MSCGGCDAVCSPLKVAGRLEGGPGNITAFLVTETRIYWSHYGSRASATGTVLSRPIDGGEVTSLANGLYEPSSLAADGTHLYCGLGNGSLVRWPLEGGALETVFGEQGRPVVSIALDAEHVYFARTDFAADSEQGEVIAIAKAGGEARVIAELQWSPDRVLVEGDHVYWITHGDLGERMGTVMRAPIEGGEPVMLAGNQAEPSGLVLEGGHLYWSSFDDGTIHRSALDGSEHTTLFESQGLLTSLALTADTLHFTTWSREDPQLGDVRSAPSSGESEPVVRLAGRLPQALASVAESLYWIVDRESVVRLPECTAGVCECPGEVCSGLCVDTSSDPSHCGACDTGQCFACDNGVCR